MSPLLELFISVFQEYPQLSLAFCFHYNKEVSQTKQIFVRNLPLKVGEDGVIWWEK